LVGVFSDEQPSAIEFSSNKPNGVNPVIGKSPSGTAKTLNNTSAMPIYELRKPSDTLHLKAAEGWLKLGNHREANE
jgi:hypothetical protein